MSETNFQVDQVESYGSNEVTGTAIVTEVNVDDKTVSVEAIPKLSPEDPEYIDGEALEKAMVEAELKKQHEFDPVEMASMMLTIYTPRFCNLADQLSNRALKRLAKGLVQYPTGPEYSPTDATEKEAYTIGKSLLDANHVLVLDTYNENKDAIMAAAESIKNNPIDVSFTEIKEETNG